MTKSEGQAVREWVVRKLTLIFDNDSTMYHRLTAAAEEAVAYYMGSPAAGDRDRYEDMLRSGSHRDEYASVVGNAVLDVIREWTEEIDGTHRAVLVDLLDFGDDVQRDMFGDHYLPDSADDINWPVTDDEDDDEDK